jgi:heme/copper-type cytochrome/quinol oxidase subunit 2
MIPSDSLKPNQFRLLDVDNKLFLPIETNIRVLITAADVLHS